MKVFLKPFCESVSSTSTYYLDGLVQTPILFSGITVFLMPLLYFYKDFNPIQGPISGSQPGHVPAPDHSYSHQQPQPKPLEILQPMKQQQQFTSSPLARRRLSQQNQSQQQQLLQQPTKPAQPHSRSSQESSPLDTIPVKEVVTVASQPRKTVLKVSENSAFRPIQPPSTNEQPSHPSSTSVFVDSHNRQIKETTPLVQLPSAAPR